MLVIKYAFGEYYDVGVWFGVYRWYGPICVDRKFAYAPTLGLDGVEDYGDCN